MSHLPAFRFIATLLLGCFLSGCQHTEVADQKIRVLILSGSNNHEWKATSAVLQTIFDKQDCFVADLTVRPDTLTYSSLQHYHVVVSNWNSWPENGLRWPGPAEEGLLRFIREGGGMVFFHASSSVFYEWPEFRQISTASWEEQTHHGKMAPVQVTIQNQDHPVTKGLSGFVVFDELWIDARQNSVFQILGQASGQPAIMVGDYGKGRIFHTILGHDARTILGHDARSMRNTGFRTLLARGTQWAATGEVTLNIPQELQTTVVPEQAGYWWLENDTILALLNHGDIIWQFNYNTRYGKPYFHPVFVGRSRITALSPDDHRWHLGQWFSWKYINGVNYWEYSGDGYDSEGITEITGSVVHKEADFSAQIMLDIQYHPGDGIPVLKESRTISVSPPDQELISMDYQMSFEALAEEVTLDRTPIVGEPDGKSWGGYAGLSLRFNQDLIDAGWISASGSNSQVNGTTGDWLYMGFGGLHGEKVGSAIFIAEQKAGMGEAWYLINNPDLPFYYFSPAILYLKPHHLQEGESIHFNYRIKHRTGPVTREMLETEYKNYRNP